MIEKGKKNSRGVDIGPPHETAAEKEGCEDVDRDCPEKGEEEAPASPAGGLGRGIGGGVLRAAVDEDALWERGREWCGAETEWVWGSGGWLCVCNVGGRVGWFEAGGRRVVWRGIRF